MAGGPGDGGRTVFDRDKEQAFAIAEQVAAAGAQFFAEALITEDFTIYLSRIG